VVARGQDPLSGSGEKQEKSSIKNTVFIAFLDFYKWL